MTSRTVILCSALWAIAGCTRPPAPRAASVARSQATGRLTDSVEYRRLCVVPPDSAVDVQRPCELRDQSPTIRKPH